MTTRPRLERERRTIRVMIRMYCAAHHNPSGELCPTCSELHDYAMERIERCPFGGDKPTCAKCPIHCYKPEKREQVRQVMHYAGPRMLLRHLIVTLLHYWDEATIKRERLCRRE